MKVFLDKKLVLNSGESMINTPDVDKLDDIEIYLINDADKNINHSIYPNGLVLQIHQYANETICYSNWNFTQLDDGNYIMEKL